MENKYTLNFNVVRDIGRLCEYMYRKGVYDAAIHANPPDILACAERDDGHTTHRFLSDFLGAEMGFEQYKDTLQVFCANVKAKYLRNFFVFAKQRHLKRAICTLCDSFYRDGLKDGLCVERARAKRFMEEVGTGQKHDRIGKHKLSSLYWLDTVKYRANSIYYIQIESEINSVMDRLAYFMSQAMMNRDR